MGSKLYITDHLPIMHRAVRFCGTRIPVSVVLDNLAANEWPEHILDQNPPLLSQSISLQQLLTPHAWLGSDLPIPAQTI